MKKIFLIFLISKVFAISVLAAQNSSVLKNNSPVRQDPNDSSKIIDYLQEGDDVRISSYPVNGSFFKIRSRNGQYGWVNKKYLSIQEDDENTLAADQAAEPVKDKIFYLRMFGGGDFFVPTDLNDSFSFNELNFGYYGGGEFGVMLGKRLSLLARSEIILKDVVARETTTDRAYAMTIRSYPVMAGMEYMFIKDFPVKFSAAIYVGAAINTSFAAEALSLPAPNRVALSSTPFTTYAKLNVIKTVGRWFSIFGEVGYRHLKTDAMETSNNANGGEVFRISGVYRSRTIDLSGMVLGAGLGFHF